MWLKICDWQCGITLTAVAISWRESSRLSGRRLCGSHADTTSSLAAATAAAQVNGYLQGIEEIKYA